uniref:Uncharacterized protein n=1 Tax=Oryza sativa subsp. japonica TaxID=39947 RepID=Q6ER50_ORYSJ|nr:hypothetical protein [Oryza sativa Japonica Group]
MSKQRRPMVAQIRVIGDDEQRGSCSVGNSVGGRLCRPSKGGTMRNASSVRAAPARTVAAVSAPFAA